MERKSESEVYDAETLVGCGLGAGMVWVMVVVIVFDSMVGQRRRKMYR